MRNDIPQPMQTFLNELYLIITKKTDGDAWFWEGQGICGNWDAYCRYHHADEAIRFDGHMWLGRQFNDKLFPFNDDAVAYRTERLEGGIYNNMYRREFIARHYKESHHAK